MSDPKPKYKTSRANRTRRAVEVTLSAEQLAALDRLAKAHPEGTRSAVVGALVLEAVERLGPE